MLWLLLIFLPLVAEAQDWDTHVVMTELDSSNNGPGTAVLDSAYCLHVFYVRAWERPPYEVGLYYQRFDNWGNILSQALELHVPGTPDSCRFTDHCPAAFLDQNESIHIVWSRTYDYWPCQSEPRVLYTRLNTQGEIVTGPLRLTTPDEPYFAYGGINMVQDCTGVIWVTEGSRCWALSEAGEILQPTMNIAPPPAFGATGAILSRDSRDQVWALYGEYVPSAGMNISAVRIDTTGVPSVPISPSDGSYVSFAISCAAFYIDANGVFHSILYREDSGLFYQRNPPGGGAADTLVIDPDAIGQYGTLFTRVGSDTLLFIWQDATQQTIGLDLNGFSLTGQWVWGPQHVAHANFGWYERQAVIWRDESYWMVGGSNINGHGQLAMIHIPGPNEPPNAISPGTNLLPDRYTLYQNYPNPFNPSTTISYDLSKAGLISLRVFDLLGREVAVLTDGMMEAGTHRVMFDGSSLASGIYFARLEAGEFVQTKKLMLMK